MECVKEGNLKFSFEGPNAFKYDDLDFYRKQFCKIQCTKGVDIIYVADDAAWLIEVKNFHKDRKKEISLEDELTQKVRDTLACLAAAHACTNNDDESKNIAAMALSRRRWRVAFHLDGLDKIVSDYPGVLQMKLTNKLESIDEGVVITNINSQTDVPWKVQDTTRAG